MLPLLKGSEINLKFRRATISSFIKMSLIWSSGRRGKDQRLDLVEKGTEEECCLNCSFVL